jgi:hypothetical protein
MMKNPGDLYGQLIEEGNGHHRVLVDRKTTIDPQHNPHDMILIIHNSKGVESLLDIAMRKMTSLYRHPDLLILVQPQGVEAQDKHTGREFNNHRSLLMNTYLPDHRLQNQRLTGDQVDNTNTPHLLDNLQHTLKNHQKKQIIMMMRSCLKKMSETGSRIHSHRHTEVPRWQKDP